MKTLWIVEYQYEGSWCWPFSEVGWSFPSRRQARDAAIKLESQSSPTRIRRFNEAVSSDPQT